MRWSRHSLSGAESWPSVMESSVEIHFVATPVRVCQHFSIKVLESKMRAARSAAEVGAEGYGHHFIFL